MIVNDEFHDVVCKNITPVREPTLCTYVCDVGMWCVCVDIAGLFMVSEKAEAL